MTGMAQCRHCGHRLAPAAQFCGDCGIPVATHESLGRESLTPGTSGVDIPTMAISTLGPTGPDDPYEWEPRRRVLPWIAAIVAVALIVAAVAVVAGTGDKHVALSAKAHRDGPIVMPWVLTFNLHDAQALLAKQGITQEIDVVRVKRSDVAPDTVVEQTPRSGMTVDQGVTLTVARPPDQMPNFVGTPVNMARATLTTLKVALTVDNVLDATASDGTVLAQTPPAGAPFAKTAHLTVARKPILTKLGDFNVVGATPTITDDATIAGTLYPNSLGWKVAVCPGSPPVTVSYLLAGHYRELLATAGLSSATDDPADRVRLEITVDGASVVSKNLDVVSTLPIDIDLTDRQQLAITLTPIAGGDPKCANAYATFGRARVLSIAQSR